MQKWWQNKLLAWAELALSVGVGGLMTYLSQPIGRIVAIIFTVVGIILVFNAYLKREHILKYPLNIYFDPDNTYCHKEEILDTPNTVEDFYRLGIYNPNPLSANSLEIILTKCMKSSDGQTVIVPVAPSKLKPFGDEKELFEIEPNGTRYINFLYVNSDFSDECILSFSHYEKGNSNNIYLPRKNKDLTYKIELLLKGSNIKPTNWVIQLKRQSNKYDPDIKISEQNYLQKFSI